MGASPAPPAATSRRPQLSSSQSPGETYELSGDVAWSNADLVGSLSTLAKTEVNLLELTPEEQQQAIVSSGFPEPVANVFVNTYEGIADGQLAHTDGTLKRLIGRPTTTLTETLVATLGESPVQLAV
jgi:NAD(P)H dehydrogenase (quinone)